MRVLAEAPFTPSSAHLESLGPAKPIAPVHRVTDTARHIAVAALQSLLSQVSLCAWIKMSSTVAFSACRPISMR